MKYFKLMYYYFKGYEILKLSRGGGKYYKDIKGARASFNPEYIVYDVIDDYLVYKRYQDEKRKFI